MFESAAVRLPGRTQRYIRTFVMSSSQLLTITESHGFRALLAAIIAIIAAFARLGVDCGTWRAQQCSPPESDAGRTLWVAHLARRSCMCTQGTSALVRHFRRTRRARVPGGLRPQPSLALWLRLTILRLRPLADQVAAAQRVVGADFRT